MASTRSILGSLRSGDWITGERIRAYSLILIVLTAGATAAFWMSGEGLLDPRSEPIGTDFVNPYAAGLLALEGRPADSYDWDEHHAMQRKAVGSSAESYYGWHYPPTFLLPAAALAALPYVPALLAWLVATFAIYAAAIRAILPNRLALLAAAAAPTTFLTVGHGQNAFLTAGLLGLGTAWLERRPWLAGMLLGCLSYKPHLGLLLPIVLAAGGHWRAFIGAAASALALAALSLAAFGPEPWIAFMETASLTRTIVLEQVATGWFRVQSLFSAVRFHGGTVEAAYAAQTLLAAAVVVALAWMWRRENGRLARAGLCAGALLATPYVLDYDLALLVPAIAFLVAEGLRHGFRPYEKTLLACAGIAPIAARLSAELLFVPLGLLTVAAVFLLAVTRALSVPRAAAPDHIGENAVGAGRNAA